MKYIFLIGFLFLQCASTGIKGDEFREQWLKENMYDEDISQKKIRPDETKTYQLKVAVLVSEKNQEGDEWNQGRRRQKPNLKLYLLKGESEQNLICEKSQSVTLHCEYPLRLQGQDILNLRLIDKRTNAERYTYGSKYYRDETISESYEEPLAQMDFIFEGQGKYLKNSGAATFVLSFKEMTTK